MRKFSREIREIHNFGYKNAPPMMLKSLHETYIALTNRIGRKDTHAFIDLFACRLMMQKRYAVVRLQK